MTLDEKSIDRDPIRQFQTWFNDAIAAKLPMPDAMTLATATPDGKPSARMVLLKQVDDDGFVFYTNYHSAKAAQLDANPFAALVFYWTQLDRQVRVEGSVTKTSPEESRDYFRTRPRESQIGAWASEQSEPVENRELLDQRMHDYEERFEGEDVPRPHSWGGYAIHPERIEFWQGRPNRMHDRIEFTRQNGGWALRRLQP